MQSLRKVGLLYHPKLPDSINLAAQIELTLRQAGVSVWSGSSWDEAAIIEQVPDLDMFITLGGDGSILRAARIAAPHNIPILGVNLGRLGFLAEMEPAEIAEKLPLLREGQYWLEERLMLHAEHQRQGQTLGCYEALNDIVVCRGSAVRVIRPAVFVNGVHLITYVADGVITATPTGSTAYTLSSGGPIVAPNVQDIILTPIAPHLTPARAFVFSGKEVITLDVATEYDAILSVDGQIDVKLLDRDIVRVEASEYTAKFARLQPPAYFYRTLLERLRGPNSRGDPM